MSKMDLTAEDYTLISSYGPHLDDDQYEDLCNLVALVKRSARADGWKAHRAYGEAYETLTGENT